MRGSSEQGAAAHSPPVTRVEGESKAPFRWSVERLRGRTSQRILNKGKYYEALGFVVNAALSRMLADILALPDITAEESNKLSELCRIFNALEGLFVEDPSQVSH